MSRVLTLEALARLRPKLQQVVLVGGVFDIIHSGHIAHLKEAKSLGKTLVVHVTSNKRVTEKKGTMRPLLDERDRANIVAAIRYVDYVFIDDRPHYTSGILKIVRPDVLFLNHEAVSPDIQAYLDGIAGRFRIVVSQAPKTNNSSAIIQKIKTSA